MRRAIFAAIALATSVALACGPSPAVLRVERFTEHGASRFDPLDLTISDVAVVHGLYDATLSLAHTPMGERFCPISWGLRYRLTFTATPKNVTTIVLEGDGCREAHLGPFDRRETNESYWAMLAGALGFSTRGNDLFPLPFDMRR